MISDEEKTKTAQEFAINEVRRGIEKISPVIDSLTSSELKRVVKSISHVAVAEHLLNNKEVTLSEKESKLVDMLFSHMDNVGVLLQLQREFTETKENENE